MLETLSIILFPHVFCHVSRILSFYLWCSNFILIVHRVKSSAGVRQRLVSLLFTQHVSWNLTHLNLEAQMLTTLCPDHKHNAVTHLCSDPKDRKTRHTGVKPSQVSRLCFALVCVFNQRFNIVQFVSEFYYITATFTTFTCTLKMSWNNSS